MTTPFTLKVCGLTRKEDVLAAVQAGADAVGFVLVGGPRKINAHEAGILALFVPPESGVKRVALISEATQLHPREAKWFDLIQVHGEHTPAQLSALSLHYGLPVIPALAARADFVARATAALAAPGVAAVLVDAHVPGQLGGTGQTVDWLAVGSRPAALSPLVLAGGLKPENVAMAIAQAKPQAVDASSGLESAPGVKDTEKIRAYVQAAKKAFAEHQ